MQASDYPSIGNWFGQFNHDGFIQLVAVIAVILISMLAIKERNKPAEIVR
ncbi:hypothetical protein [Candidatus Nitrososphaera gargensis]|nr:hypothetical protein [Candidatus Nitrososphaera gargensis]